MNRSRTYLLILVLAFFIPATAQEDDSTRGVTVIKEKKKAPTGNTYALIIGISAYQHFPKLEYADKDALAFKQLLMSKAGGEIDSTHIFLCLNQNATAANIWRGVSWLERKADSTGEKAYVYFAGHGDAADASQAYLLANDALNEGDPNLYNAGGTFEIHNLKASIKKMAAKGVSVVLITDACRTNDLPGKENGAKWTFTSITEERCGAIQMTSCAGDEKSAESQKWGNGRGVFSYYLVNGLYGLADTDPENEEVTLYELQKYVSENVRRETRSLSEKKPKQNPVFCCAEFNETGLVKVDPATKALVIETMNTGGPGNTYAIRGNISFKDSVQQQLYNHFSLAINKKNLVGAYAGAASAEHFLDTLLLLIRDENIKTDLQDYFLVELLNTAQQIINRYTQPPREDSLTSENSIFFREGARCLESALKYLSGNPDLREEVTAKKLFLEASAIAEFEDWYGTLAEGIAKADSSVKITNTSYTQNTLGILYKQSGKYDTAITHFNLAAGLAPRWTYPLLNLGNMYRDELNEYDSAILYYRRCISINPNYKNAYYNIGVLHYQENKYDSALQYFRNALGLNASYANAYNYLGITFLGTKQYDSARNYLKKVIELDSTYEIGYYNLGLAYYYLGEYDSSITYSKKAIALNRSYSNAYVNLGLAFSYKKRFDSAAVYYRLALHYDPKQHLAYYNLAFDFEDLDQPDSALYYYNKCLSIKPHCGACRAKGFIYYKKKDPEVALFCFHKALVCLPEDEYIYNAIGTIYFDERSYDSAYKYYSEALKIDANMSWGNFNVGRYYFYRSAPDYDSALTFFKKAEKLLFSSDLFFYLMGEVYYQKMKDDSAMIYFNKSLAINPDYSYSLSALAYLYEYSGETEKAILYFKRLLKVEPVAATAFKIAKLYAKQKDIRDIFTYLEIALQTDPAYVYDISYATEFKYLEKNARFLELMAKYRKK